MCYQGYKIGALTAHNIVGRVYHGRNSVNVWLCQCDCSRMLEIDQNSLLKGIVLACKVCRRGPCVVCDKDITNDEYSVKRNTCSDDCYKENRRRRSRESYRRRADADPYFNRKHYQSALARDPDHNKKRYRRLLKRIALMPDIERKAFLKKQYDASNTWTVNKRTFLKLCDPFGYEIFLERCRSNYRRHQDKKQMVKHKG
jgi:hypothetical protein